jgi:putative Holliday junction resolvase
MSDPLGVTAQGLTTLERGTDEAFMKRMKDLVKEHEVQEIVVGLPLNMNGSYGPQAHDAIAVADRLKEELKVSTVLWDERMSTLEVERIMIQADASRRKRKEKIDKLAAQVVLQSYLNTKK